MVADGLVGGKRGLQQLTATCVGCRMEEGRFTLSSFLLPSYFSIIIIIISIIIVSTNNNIKLII